LNLLFEFERAGWFGGIACSFASRRGQLGFDGRRLIGTLRMQSVRGFEWGSAKQLDGCLGC
jgi:hypothetical protein